MPPYPLETMTPGGGGGMMLDTVGGAGGVVAHQSQGQPGHISLSVLIDMIVQRSYHELTILAELLPRKTDMERKVEIFNFASRTRMLFIRLLALVKWASSASKVDKCNNIMMFLEKQSNLFLDTADQLARMARETLVRATLPNFHLPAAAEILTTGGYTRMPRCIKERIIPPPAISHQEKKMTLLKLNQVIEQRLVNSAIPLRMRNLKVADGTVTFTVKNEFECRLTLLGDSPTECWRLLSLEMLVEDRETGQGKSLIHTLQVHYVQSLVQSRLESKDTVKPLHDLYKVLHSMAQLLQLEVLYNQTLRLCSERLGDYIRVEEYVPGRALTISYWRELSSRDPAVEQGYRLSVQVDPQDTTKPLIVVHTPSLTSKEAETAEKSIRTEHLSVESLLVHTIYVRTRARLTELKTELQKKLGLGDVEPTLHGSPAVLAIPILQPCLRAEQLLISVDTHTGIFLAHVPQYLTNPYSQNIQNSLNADRVQLEAQVSDLRYWITARRIEKTIQQLPATPYEQLPLMYDLRTHPLSKMKKHKMFIRLHKQPSSIIVVDYNEKAERECEIQYRYYYLLTKPCSIEDDPKDETVVKEIPRVYMKALNMVEFDSFLITHGTTTVVDNQDLSQKIIGKRKPGGKVEAPIKRTKFPAYFLSDLAHVVSYADERIPFTALEAQLTAKDIVHSGVCVESSAVGLYLTIVKFPPIPDLPESICLEFSRQLLSATIRRKGPVWVLEWVFLGSPVLHTNSQQKARSPIYSYFELETVSECEKTVKNMLADWIAMVHLHIIVKKFQRYLESGITQHLASRILIKQYNYKSLTLEYGAGAMYSVTVTWKKSEEKFSLVFGSSGQNNGGGGNAGSVGTNPHTLFKCQHEIELNRHQNLALMCQILLETLAPCKSIARLPNTIFRGMSSANRNATHQTFTILPQSTTHVKIFFYGKYCMDVHMRAEGLISIRDGAYSRFDQVKVLEELQPIPGFKAFLSKYADEAAINRRASQTEDDNPPSPIMETDTRKADSSKLSVPGSGGSLNPVSPHSGFLQSPPSMRQPSPAVPSPANPSGSPFPSAASPLGGSPRSKPSPRFAGTSPKPVVGGGASSSSHLAYTRTLPARLWAGAIPTVLPIKAFHEIFRPTSVGNSGITIPPVHRFLGCVFMRRQLQHIIKNEDYLTPVPSQEPSVIGFRVESLICRVSINQENCFQSLHLKIMAEDQNYWQADHIIVLQKYFDEKVVAPPYRPNTMLGFVRLLHSQPETLKALIQLMRFEVQPELVQQSNLKWNISLCLTFPPVAPNVFPVGQAGILGTKEKILIFMQLTRVNQPPGQDPISLAIPIVYNTASNQTSVASLERLNNPALNAAQQHLSRWDAGNRNQGRCTILPSIHDMLLNLTLPNEPAFSMGPAGGPGSAGGPPGGPAPPGMGQSMGSGM